MFGRKLSKLRCLCQITEFISELQVWTENKAVIIIQRMTESIQLSADWWSANILQSDYLWNLSDIIWIKVVCKNFFTANMYNWRSVSKYYWWIWIINNNEKKWYWTKHRKCQRWLAQQEDLINIVEQLHIYLQLYPQRNPSQ